VFAKNIKAKHILFDSWPETGSPVGFNFTEK
jgi:hypothetical protein